MFDRAARIRENVEPQKRAPRLLVELLRDGARAGLPSIEWPIGVHQPGRVIGTVNYDRDGAEEGLQTLTGWCRVAGAGDLSCTPNGNNEGTHIGAFAVPADRQVEVYLCMNVPAEAPGFDRSSLDEPAR
ncbi:hypothetical protein ACFXGA_18590 [Actinosynnema sp. NPDC059335]|uniref:hypothetical protein n=1 Tax=Actinosynnema sp. NPDC059335 TaxID=3346804 RepID=UPI003670A29B